MNLTYEVTENGYKIFKNGKTWIKQDRYIPYPADTMEESAQSHIDAIIEGMSEPVDKSTEDKILELEQQLQITQEAIDFLIMTGGM